MDVAVRGGRQQAEHDGDEARLDPRIGDEISRMLSMIRVPEEPRKRTAARAEAPRDTPDWSASLGLAERVGKALRLSGDRARKLEERMEGVIQRASEELEAAHKRIENLEARLRASEAREKQLEVRARETEQWLHRIHETLSEEMAANLGLFPEGADPDAQAR